MIVCVRHDCPDKYIQLCYKYMCLSEWSKILASGFATVIKIQVYYDTYTCSGSWEIPNNEANAKSTGGWNAGRRNPRLSI